MEFLNVQLTNQKADGRDKSHINSPNVDINDSMFESNCISIKIEQLDVSEMQNDSEGGDLCTVKLEPSTDSYQVDIKFSDEERSRTAIDNKLRDTDSITKNSSEKKEIESSIDKSALKCTFCFQTFMKYDAYKKHFMETHGMAVDYTKMHGDSVHEKSNHPIEEVYIKQEPIIHEYEEEGVEEQVEENENVKSRDNNCREQNDHNMKLNKLIIADETKYRNKQKISNKYHIKANNRFENGQNKYSEFKDGDMIDGNKLNTFTNPNNEKYSVARTYFPPQNLKQSDPGGFHPEIYSEETEVSNKAYSCCCCDFKSTNSNILIKHMEKHKDDAQHSSQHSNYKPAREIYLDQQAMTDTDKKPYTCQYCLFIAEDQVDLVKHKRTHVGEKIYSCQHCDYKTVRNANLTRHMTRHTGKKPYPCEQCDYNTARKADLARHMRTHTIKKIFSCQHCHYNTTIQDNLDRHLTTHTNDKPYSCKQCHYKSSRKSDLVKHMITHTTEKPYSCQQCSYKTARKIDLVKHMTTHTGVKPFSCQHCIYRAAQKECLIRHMKRHTGEKPYSCRHCHYKTARKESLGRHMMTHADK